MNKLLKDKLEYHYKAFDKSKIEPDPLQFLHLYSKPEDVELIGLIASVFAYGNVAQINKTILKIIKILGSDPVSLLLKSNKKELNGMFKGVFHRFYSEDDVVVFFILLKNVYTKYGSAKNLFLLNYNETNKNLKNEITAFSENLYGMIKKEGRELTHGLSFMFPFPEKGSACKRMNLFLRWMVRRDELDFGLWSEIPTGKLLIPVDTHIARICKELHLTERKQADWKMAEEITENLKQFDPLDPVKYDFAICHIGMRKLKL